MKFRVSISILLILILNNSWSQSGTTVLSKPVPQGWHLMDPAKDGQWGINLNNAYTFLYQTKKKSVPVTVAVIDSGIDTTHEDLKNVLWINKKEIAQNGIDDDHNGYIDDINGWNFLGNKDGKNVEQDSYEGARVYYNWRDKFESSSFDSSKIKKEDTWLYDTWKKARIAIKSEENEPEIDFAVMNKILKLSKKNDSIIKIALHKEVYSGNDLELYEVQNSMERIARSAMLSMFKGNNMMEATNQEFLEGFDEFIKTEEKKALAKGKPPIPYRKQIVQDDENDFVNKSYGNNNLMVSLEASQHGTHVSGIIAASRNNNKGIQGIADNVRIMSLRVVPDGDEHDKDIALAIRYAVDNGAKVINMSFGKSFSPFKEKIDEAVMYANSKNVLFIHAAGNDHKNVDSSDNYPSSTFTNGKDKATNWITVGASANGDTTAEGFTASFSNYGKNEVDLFAPGVKIYSTYPGGNVYRNMDGTSMAAPVVTGTSALILSYFPNLTPQEVKFCLETGVQKIKRNVRKPGSEEIVAFNELCKTGGLLDAYNAVKIASSISKKKLAKK